MGGDSWSIGCEFESLYQLLDGSFLTTPTVASLDVIVGMLRKQNLLLSHWHHHHQVLFCLSNDLVAIHGCRCCEQEEFIALPNLKQPNFVLSSSLLRMQSFPWWYQHLPRSNSTFLQIPHTFNPNGFCYGHQCSRNLTLANNMKVVVVFWLQ